MDEPLVRCLMVETGREATVLRLLKAMNLGTGIAPQRVRIRKIRGVWRKDFIRLLPGYVFVFPEEDIPIRYYGRIEHVLKALRYDREPDGYLRGGDLEFAGAVRDLDGKLNLLNAVDEDGFIRVTDPLLETLHGEVISVEKGKRLVRLRVTLIGQTRELQMNYQLLGGDGRPLEPAEDMPEAEDGRWITPWTPDFSDDLAEEMDREGAAPPGTGEAAGRAGAKTAARRRQTAENADEINTTEGDYAP